MTKSSDEQTITGTPEMASAATITPQLARAAVAFLDRTPTQGIAEARTLLHLAAVLEAIIMRGEV